MPKNVKKNPKSKKRVDSTPKRVYSLMDTAAIKDGWLRVVSYHQPFNVKGTTMYSLYSGEDFHEAKKIADENKKVGVACYVHNFHNRVVYQAR